MNPDLPDIKITGSPPHSEQHFFHPRASRLRIWAMFTEADAPRDLQRVI